MEQKYFNLHNHTNYSNLRLVDCITKVDKLIDRAIELDYSGLAITEHECISSHIEAIKHIKILREENKIDDNWKLILGNEIYLVDDKYCLKENYISGETKFYHFILLAKDKEGHKQIRELSSIAWDNLYSTGQMERVPTGKSDLERVIKGNHVIGSTACLGGEFSQLILKLIELEQSNNIKLVEEIKWRIDNFIQWCISVFGKECFFIEIQPSNMIGQIEFNKKAIEIAKAYGLKWIVTTDTHYLNKEDRMIHKAYLNSKDGDREVDDFYSSTYLQSIEEIKDYLSYLNKEDIEQAINNTLLIGNMVENYDLKSNVIVPRITLPKFEVEHIFKQVYEKYPYLEKFAYSNDDQDRYLFKLIEEGFKNKIWTDTLTKEYFYQVLERINTELKELWEITNVINTKLSSYYITTRQIINIMWNEGDSLVGVARGSVTGFLICYLIDITQINPLQWGLPHWRHLTASRPELPDIDLDSAANRRKQILKALQNYFGEDKVLNICTFGTEGSRSAVLTACFEEGTLVKTPYGEKRIENIQTGDVVWTTNGWEKVITPTILNNKDLITVKTRNSTNQKIVCTPDHEFLTLSKVHKGRVKGVFNRKLAENIYSELTILKSTDENYQKLYGYLREVDLDWTEAKNINNSLYGVKKIDLNIDSKQEIKWNNQMKRDYGIGISETIKINGDLCELIGIWLAEGSSNQNSISFTIHRNETYLKERIIELMWKVFGLDNFYIYERKDTLAISISYASRQLINFMSQLFNINSIDKITQWGKRVPRLLMYIDPKLQLQVFKGWFIGDGYARNQSLHQNFEAKGVTVSKELADDMTHILNRNFINPYIIVEDREKKVKVYNVMLYGRKASVLYDMKYNSNLKQEFSFSLNDVGEMDIPFIYNGELYLKTKLELLKAENENICAKQVYCLKVPSENFTVNGTVVHNCRGLSIDNDTAQYISDMIPFERGSNWPIKDCINGNEEKSRKPVKEFINEIKSYENLLDVALGIEGLINKRSIHASGVFIYNDNFVNFNARMKAPNGQFISQWNMNDSEYCGNLKVDLLTIEALDKIRATLDMLVEDGYIEWQGSLRKTYNKYIHPDVLDYDSPEMWKMIADNTIVDLFQFDTEVGLQAAQKVKPTNMFEMAVVNSLMRLMGDGSKQPVDQYVEYKRDIKKWYEEMRSYKLTSKEIKVLEKYLKKIYGVADTQEVVMELSMDEKIADFDLKQSNTLRKGIAKKKGKIIDEAKAEFFKQGEKIGTSNNLLKYVWDVQIKRQLGYSFSINHTTPYSCIGLQEMNLAFHYPKLYWETACLSVNAGADEESEDNKSTNYGKIASSIGNMQHRDVKIALPDINKASFGFKADLKNNQIIFGLKGINGIGDDVVKNIISNRPYISFEDFLNRMVLCENSLIKNSHMIQLIKAGCFDELVNKSRIDIMKDYLNQIYEPKKDLGLRNINNVIEANLVPEDKQIYFRYYNFKNYITSKEFIHELIPSKRPTKKGYSDRLIKLDDIAYPFYQEHFSEDNITEYYDNTIIISENKFMKEYNKKMEDFKIWISNEELLKKYNDYLYQEIWNKHAKGSIPKWEMDALCFYYTEHELCNVNMNKFNIVNFFEMPIKPKVVDTYTRKGIKRNKFEIVRIAGTVLDKNKHKHSISLLTVDGVVNVKYYDGAFYHYDRQISQKNKDGSKTVLEKSWFSRGSLLIIAGYRRGNTFRPYRYKDTIYQHTTTKIVGISDNGDLILESERTQE